MGGMWCLSGERQSLDGINSVMKDMATDFNIGQAQIQVMSIMVECAFELWSDRTHEFFTVRLV